jgi:uncharacterized membrane protein (DUF2068 family)
VASQRLDGLRLLAVYKFGKAALLLATLLGVSALLNADLAARLSRWSTALTDHFDRVLVLRALAWFDRLNPLLVHRVLLVSGAYLGLVLLEGIGLWLHRRWAEWLSILSSGAFIPFELWRIVTQPQHRTLIAYAVLAGNVLIVIYLVLKVRKGTR